MTGITTRCSTLRVEPGRGFSDRSKRQPGCVHLEIHVSMRHPAAPWPKAARTALRPHSASTSRRAARRLMFASLGCLSYEGICAEP